MFHHITDLRAASGECGNVRWPRELNALQLQKTHAYRKSTSKSRKHLHQFDSRWCKCSQHKQIKKHCKCSQYNQIHFICSAFLFWLCCEHLQHLLLKTSWWICFIFCLLQMLTDGLEWCGLLWCFYQLFGLSFWRHPFTAEHPLLRHWCRDTFLQTDEETNSS